MITPDFIGTCSPVLAPLLAAPVGNHLLSANRTEQYV
jgi:hypothetical protein